MASFDVKDAIFRNYKMPPFAAKDGIFCIIAYRDVIPFNIPSSHQGSKIKSERYNKATEIPLFSKTYRTYGMKSKALYLIYIFPILFLLSLAACDDMDDYSSDPKHTLWFSQDTLRMDTVLTGIPTSTRQLKVYNPHKKALLISSIILADAGKSGFRINVDGIRGDQFSDIEIAGEDSLYIFVEATLPQQDNADIRLIKDSILFQLNGIRQEVKLRAYAQDAFTFRGK